MVVNDNVTVTIHPPSTNIPTPPTGLCPNCGRCPSCGHVPNAQWYPNWYPVYPSYQPFYC